MSLSFSLLVSEMWFMELRPSHFLITFWYVGAYNDSFWAVRVVMCCVSNNRSLLSLQLWPTLFCEMLLGVQMIGASLWCEKRALTWEWVVSRSAMSWLSDLGRWLHLSRPLQNEASDSIVPRLCQLWQPSSLVFEITLEWTGMCCVQLAPGAN